MSLLELYNEKYTNMTDKGTYHSYIQNFYNHQFKKYKDLKNTIVEIGVQYGGSIRLFHEYFPNSTIYGIDVDCCDEDFRKWAQTQTNINYIIADGYDDSVVKLMPNKIDILIDDGPHSAESQLMCLKKYLPKMNKGGLFIIEDVQDDSAMRALYENVPDELKEHTYPLDYRFDRDRYDDRMLVIKIPA